MAGGAPAAAVARLNAEIAAEAVPEWRAVLGALQADGHAPASVGFVGFSLGAGVGVPLIAGEPRITTAVLGLVGHHGLADDATRITVPVQLVVQWDDELVVRDDALPCLGAVTTFVGTAVSSETAKRPDWLRPSAPAEQTG